jgi:hypothetical protein
LNPEFLDAEDILEMHAGQLAEHGGLNGVRDMNLMDSAVAQPMAQFGGQFLNGDLFEMAAALHISSCLESSVSRWKQTHRTSCSSFFSRSKRTANRTA